jgi:DDE domain
MTLAFNDVPAAALGYRAMITDKLASYSAAKREVMPGIEHRQQKGLNNRAENSHQPTRRRERQIAPRIRISLYGDESARCSDSNRLDLPSASSA